MRRFAVRPNGSANEGLWLRTCYDKEFKEAHQSVWHSYVKEYDAIDVDSLVLDDAELFRGPWTAMLEILPERVTNSCVDTGDGGFKARVLNELRERDGRDDDSEEKKKSLRELYAELGHHEFMHDMCRRYLRYHKACIDTYILIEDRETQAGEGLFLVYLDEKGNVVRQLRHEPDELDNFTAAWHGRFFDENPAFEDLAEVGPTYLPGGTRGPPYGQGPGPYWLQLIDEGEGQRT